MRRCRPRLATNSLSRNLVGFRKRLETREELPQTAVPGLGVALALLCWTAAPAAHDVPNDVRIQVFLKPEGQRLRLLVRVPLASMNDISWPTAGVFLNLADPEMTIALNDGAKVWIADRIGLYEDDVRSRTRGSPRSDGVAAVRHLVRSLRRRAAIPAWPGAAGRHRGRQKPGDGRRAVRVPDPSRTDPASRSIRTYRLLGLESLTVLRFVTPDGAERALAFHDDPGLVRLDPRWFAGGAAVRRRGLPPHPRAAPITCSSCSAWSFRSAALAAGRRDGVHRRALDHADRLRLRHGAGRRLVSAAGRDADRDVDRLHGAREHRGAGAAPPLADRVRLRTGARLRLLVRAARHAAAGRLAPADLAAVLQPRRRDRSGGRARRAASRARAAVPIRAPSGSARSSCPRSWRTPAGTG